MKLPLIAATAVSMMFMGPAVVTPSSATEWQDEIYAKKLTKSQCAKKRGYAWNPQTKRCVKVVRGSY